MSTTTSNEHMIKALMRSDMHLRAAILLGMLLANDVGAIVSMESLHLGKPQEGLHGEVDMAWSGSSGNTEKSDLSAGARLEYRYGLHADFLVGQYMYGDVAGVENTNRSFVHGRHIYQHTPLLAWEGFAQGETNEFARLQFRGLAGGGTRWTLIERAESQAAFLGIGAMYSRETYNALAGVEPAYTERLWRGNLYLVFKYQFRPGVRLANFLYYQPALDDIADYRLLDSIALQVDIIELLAVQLSVNVSHDSRPPATVEETDVVYRTGFNWKF